MAKNSPATLNSKTVRISLHTWSILHEMSEHTGITIAEALDKLLWDTKTIPKVLTPVFTVKPKPAMSVNGNKHVAIAIKSKGGTIDG